MTDMNDRNAAIWFASDGFDPKEKGINGRRVAGESFLRGFLRHASIDQAVTLTHGIGEQKRAEEFVKSVRPELPVRGELLMDTARIAPVGVVYYSSPGLSTELWRRAPYGSTAWAMCGITHTTSTAAVMRGFFETAVSPVAEWDAIICTSRAVHASVTYQYDLIEDHMRRRFRAPPPVRPLLPVIPLGIHCDDFRRDDAARKALRKQIGAGDRDMVITTIARLTPHEKFDPLPIYIALQQAAEALPKGQKLHYVMCGIFNDGYSRKVFEGGAKGLMPDVGFTVLDGAKAEDRKAALSGADVFAFLIDNIQETFGLAPVEGMAAGLPILASDWDGIKDTVSDDVGIRIPTRFPEAEAAIPETLRYMGGSDSYIQYCGTASGMTQIDIPALVAAVLRLAGDPELRARMGAAARARADHLYDWSRVIPTMQDLWAEQNLRRKRAAKDFGKGEVYKAHELPIAPSPFALFSSYPTRIGGFAKDRYILPPKRASQLGTEATLSLRDYASLGRAVEGPKTLERVRQAVADAPATGVTGEEIAASTKLPQRTVDRSLAWLLKYDFLRIAAIP